MVEKLEEIDWDVARVKKTKKGDKKNIESMKHIQEVMWNLLEKGNMKKVDNILEQAINNELYFGNYISFIMLANNFKQSLPHYKELYDKAFEQGIQEHNEDIASRTLTGFEPNNVNSESIEAWEAITGIKVPKPKTKVSLNEYIGQELKNPINLSRYSRCRNITRRI